jgi:hypothetical protein
MRAQCFSDIHQPCCTLHTAIRWHDDYNQFKAGVKDLEVMMTNVIQIACEAQVRLQLITHTSDSRAWRCRPGSQDTTVRSYGDSNSVSCSEFCS